MTFPAHGDRRYFTLDAYRELLTRALACHYRIGTFDGFRLPDDQPVLLLRHDLDGPLDGARAMAELEAGMGVHATYFVQACSDFYNLLSHPARAFMHRLVQLGHEIGLHYEARRYLEHGTSALASDLRLLEDLAGKRIRSASQHIPVDGDTVDIVGHVDNDAYAARFTQAPMTYISDSLMAWRQATPHDLIDRGASFQLLIHPEVWAGAYRDMGEALDGMMAEELALLRTRYADVRAHYEDLIATRIERDRRFQERRAAVAQPVGGCEDG